MNARAHIQAKASSAPTPTGSHTRTALLPRRPLQQTASMQVPPIIHEVLRSPGQPLDPQTCAFMETRFGHNFSQVRVHTDARAAESAQAVHALAYTVGQDIVLGSGQYAPGTAAGGRLLAHELTHVVQQSGRNRSPLLCAVVSRHHDVAEAEADRTSERLMAGLSVQVTTPSLVPTLQRQGEDDIEQPVEQFTPAPVPPVSPPPPPPPGYIAGNILRVSASTPPGWANVIPTYGFLIGEPQELPHFLQVREEGLASGSEKRVTVLEGRYKGKQSNVTNSTLVTSAAPAASATAKFDVTKGEFWYGGGTGPITATTDVTNPTPQGKYDIEIPDFQHRLGTRYGDFATTWFRLGHSGDRYLHPGRISLGCTTIKDTPQWPSIYRYLISARKDDRSVGELEVV